MEQEGPQTLGWMDDLHLLKPAKFSMSSMQLGRGEAPLEGAGGGDLVVNPMFRCPGREGRAMRVGKLSKMWQKGFTPTYIGWRQVEEVEACTESQERGASA